MRAPCTGGFPALMSYADLQVWVEMVKFCRNLRNISPLKEMTSRSTVLRQSARLTILAAKEHNPGPDVQTDEQIVGTSLQHHVRRPN